MGAEVNGVKLPGHRQTEEFMEGNFSGSMEKKWGSGQQIPVCFLKVILKHHGIGQFWKAESSA